MAIHAHAASASPLRRFLDTETVAGLLLMASAAAALLAANSPLWPAYRQFLHAQAGPMPVQDWINDGAMALFFLLVGLEIKREVLHGQLRRWDARLLPGLAAAGGMLGPALVFAAFNAGTPGQHGWAVPAATDIAFSLGVIALLGSRVPASLKVFLTALAVLDDLGAVVIIALVYAAGVWWPALGVAGGVLLLAVGLNAAGIRRLWPYLMLGVVLWVAVHASGVHATVAGVLIAFAIPADARPGDSSPLHRLEAAVSGPVAFVVLPLFGLANAGVSLAGSGWSVLASPVTLGVAAGLFVGKQVGIFATVASAVALGLARRPAGSSWLQLYGVALLCGIGFTMSLFIGLLAFAGTTESLDDTKVGVFVGSLLSAIAGAVVLQWADRSKRQAPRLRE